MNGLRNLVFDTLRLDPGLNALGLNTDNLYPNWSPDSPQQQIWATIRWLPAEIGISSSVPVGMALWVYNRNPDYGPIMSILKAARPLLGGLIGQSTGEGWVSGVDWRGGSPDLFDDAYVAYTRNEEYRIIASGS